MKQQLLETLDYILASDTSVRLHVDKIYEIRTQLNEFLTDEEVVSISNKIRSKVQLEANQAIESAHGFGSVIMATGTGKSKVAVNLATRKYAENKKSKGLLVVPTEKLRDENWKEEFVKWKALPIYENNITRCCYASLDKFEGEEFDYVILDEGHNITEAKSIFFEQNTVKSCILLTATKPKDFIKNNIISNLNLNVVYELSLDEAVKLGLVAPYDISVINITLNNIDKYIKAGSKTKVFYQTEKKRYEYLSSLCRRGSKFPILNRMRFIYNLRSKTLAAKYILEHIIPKELRTLIFCGSIEQADQVCENRFHSKTDDKSYELFKKLLIDRMSCVNALNEGHNIPGLDCAFVIQLNSNELNLIQRIGRIVRYRPGHIAKIIILCVTDSVDKNWVEKATLNLNGVNIKSYELSHLKMGLETINFD